MIRKYTRLELASTDNDNREYYKSKKMQWLTANKEFISANSKYLREDTSRYKTYGISALQKLTNIAKSDITSTSFRDYKYTDKVFSSKKEMSDYLYSRYNIKFSDSKKAPIDEQTLANCINFMDKFNDYFKSFDDKNMLLLPKICVKANSGMNRAIGYYQYNSYTHYPVELALNSAYYGNIDYFKKYIDSAKESKWTVANANVEKTFIHEYGHHISNSIREMFKDRMWTGKFIDECLDEYNKKYKTSIKAEAVQDIVSRYACKNKEECFAETFAEYFIGTGSREFANIFGAKLEKILKGVK